MYNFFALLSRMKYINRWGLMRSTREENLSEHSLEVAIIAHALALLGKKRFNRDLDENKIAVLSLFHDSTEILTGDLPTPIKYYNEEMKRTYDEIEHIAKKKILDFLPDDLRDEYEGIISKKEEDADLWRYVKAADKISALIKCIEERKMGNNEFVLAESSIRKALDSYNMAEVDCFLKEFLPSYELTLDEQDRLF